MHFRGGRKGQDSITTLNLPSSTRILFHSSPPFLIPYSGGNVEKVKDDLLSLCDKLKEDVDENIHHLKYKFECLTNSTIQQLKKTMTMH